MARFFRTSLAVALVMKLFLVQCGGLQIILTSNVRISDSICTQSHHESNPSSRNRLGILIQNTDLKTVDMGSSYTPKRDASAMCCFGVVGFPLTICIEYS